ncbi:hypothetical protein [Haloferula helveola]
MKRAVLQPDDLADGYSLGKWVRHLRRYPTSASAEMRLRWRLGQAVTLMVMGVLLIVTAPTLHRTWILGGIFGLRATYDLVVWWRKSRRPMR